MSNIVDGETAPESDVIETQQGERRRNGKAQQLATKQRRFDETRRQKFREA